MESIRIRAGARDQMLQAARQSRERECCGLLAGRDGVITNVLPAVNTSPSATEYEIAPEELIALFQRIRAEGLQHLGIYHSHPRGPNLPSPRDVKLAYYPELAYVIISPAPHVTRPVRAFRIGEGRFSELSIEWT